MPVFLMFGGLQTVAIAVESTLMSLVVPFLFCLCNFWPVMVMTWAVSMEQPILERDLRVAIVISVS